MTNRKVFPDSIIPLPDHAGITPAGLKVNLDAPTDINRPLPLLFSLKVPDDQETALKTAVADGEALDRKRVAEGTGSDKAKLDKLIDWLTQNGYHIDHRAPDDSGVYATAPISAIQSSLLVKMVPVMKDGITYPSAQNAPSMPNEIGEPVTDIVGLQPFRRTHKHFRVMARTGNRATFGADALNNAFEPPYFPGEILKAYGGAGTTLTGKGQTIGILIDAEPTQADLEAFWKATGVAGDMSRVAFINVANIGLPPPEGEETLDVSWTTGIAPNAQIRVYCAGDLGFVALNRALDAIIADAASISGFNQVSISLGIGEKHLTKSDLKAQHLRLLKLAGMGVNVFVSSGDGGSDPDGPPTPEAEYAASDDAVIAVGGTSLVLRQDGSIASETAWAGSGGGRSTFFPRPKWQTAPGVPVGAARCVPDVCAAADRNTGAFLVLQGKPIKVGGTSWSAPVWAGLCALINEARANAKQQPIGFLNPHLYPLASAGVFRDITSGSNGAYSAGAGFDMVTGLGSPNLSALLAHLVPPAPADTPAKTMASTD